MRGAEILVSMLEAHGVEVIFGLPGDTSMAFYDALRDSAIEHVLARDERSAGYMADAYARLGRRPGVVEAPSGGGATYLLPAAAEANDSYIPMVLLTSDTPLSSDHRASITALDQTSLYDSSTRESVRALRPEYIPHLVKTIFRAATSPPGGAAHLSLPEDVLSARSDVDADLCAKYVTSTYPAGRARPDASEVGRAAELAHNSERPLILAGGGVHLSRAQDTLLRLAENLGAAIVTSMDGKGAVAENHPQVLGVIGGNGAKKATNRAVEHCDFVLAVGTKLNSTTTWGGNLFSHSPTLVHVDADPKNLGLNADPDVGIFADAKLAMEDLLDALADMGKGPERNLWFEDLAHEAREETVNAHAQRTGADGLVHPGAVFGAFSRKLPEESILIADAGTPTPYLMAYYPAGGGQKTTYAARSHGSLGYALPASMGARMARPDDPVIALVGDGSLNMTVGELETLAKTDSPIVVVHFRNESYGWIKMLQKLYYDERYLSVDFSPDVSYVEAAAAMGARSRLVENVEQLERELEKSLGGGLSFLEIRVPPETEITPPVAAWQKDEVVSPEKRRRRSY